MALTDRVARTNGLRPQVGELNARGARLGDWADSRLGLAKVSKGLVRKVFPEHWSYMLGEIALWSFVVLVISGIFLSLWFDPSMAETTYQGSYDALRGVGMSRAYASTLDISFDVRGGLYMRQVHHWAALVFIAGMFIHMIRVFVTGAFRKPREVTWLVGGTMLILGVLEGFLGYSLPDDLLSGTGLRIADGIVKSTPVVGTYGSLLLFGGEYPGASVVPRFYIVHVLLIPGMLLALIAFHLLLIVYHKHTQWPGPGKQEDNLVGLPFFPIYIAKTTGFFFVVFGTLSLMAGLVAINPVWKFGPYDPTKVTAGSQPDWYLGFTEGATRLMPSWETELFGGVVSWNVFIPTQLVPMMFLVAFLGWPFLEAWVTGDKREHHLLQRPRNAPTRTAIAAATMSAYGVLWASGANDIFAITFRLSVNHITYALRVAIFLLPVVVFIVTKRWCLGLQHVDHERLSHGYETGVIVRGAGGGYTGLHAPLATKRAVELAESARGVHVVRPDEHPERSNGVPRPRSTAARLRIATLMFGQDNAHDSSAAGPEESGGDLPELEQESRRPL